MEHTNRLPSEVRAAIDNYGASVRLDQFLAEWRTDLEGRNFLNTWTLSTQDQAFVEFHNNYRRQRKIYPNQV